MPVDDDDIDVKLTSLRDRLALIHTQRVQLLGLLERLESIKKHDQKIPMDNGTKIRMTTVRRQAVYDSIVSEFATLP